MCGITGFFGRRGIGAYFDDFLKANRVVSYRGPDGEGIALFDCRLPGKRFIRYDGVLPDRSQMDGMTVGLGHRRLAIIDLSPNGRQPMANEDQSIWVVCNGEIYNYVELRSELESAGHQFRSNSDTEVVLHGYEEWGEECVHRFQGMWAFALADLGARRVFCSPDRYGIKPFHYFFDGERFVFGSEIKQLLCFRFIPREINERAAYEFLAYGAVDYCEETFFGRVYKLLQGHNIVLDLENALLTVKRYYEPSLAVDKNSRFRGSALEFRRLFTDSVRLHLRSDVEVGSCLSGGLDSSSLVCMMRRLLGSVGREDIQYTFSSHFAEEEANELKYMKSVIKAVGAKARFVYPTPEEFLEDMEAIVWHQDEPFGSTSIFAQWSVFKLVRQSGIKVVLDGQGADEVLGGYVSLAYYFFRELQAKGKHLRLVWEIMRHAQFHPETWRDMIPLQGVWRQVRWLKGRKVAPVLDWIKPELVEQFRNGSKYSACKDMLPFGEMEQLNNVLYQLAFFSNLQSLLRYEDRNSMAFSVEARVPYLDHRLVEFVFTLPASFKIWNGYTKRLLRKGMEGILPEEIRRRTSKLGFATPERTWQRSHLRPLMEEALRDRRMEYFVDRDRALAYQREVEQRELSDSASWRWINLYLWMKAFGF